MVKVKSIDKARRNYKNAASTAAARYKESIDGIDWQGPALEAQALYEEMMMRASTRPHGRGGGTARPSPQSR